jgi:hypothetical protein
MKDDERRLLLAVAGLRPSWPFQPIPVDRRMWPRDIIPTIGIHCKRCWYLLKKWSRKGWYDYGVTVDLGWLTEKGKEVAENAKQTARPTD